MTAPPQPRPAFARWLSETNDITQTFLSAGRIPGLINLGGGLPDPEVFPVADLARLAERAVADHPGDSLAYAPIDGLPELRDEIARRFSVDGLTLTRDNVLVTTAGMQGLDLVGKVLLEPGAVIAAQSPAYLGALDAWRPRHPVYRAMRLGSNGFDPAAAMAGAQFAYTVPNFSNPSGRLVPLAEREALVDAAHATGTWLVEDDPYGALHYDSDPVPRLLTLSGRGQPGPYDGPVVYMGTLSKELAPGLRIGWVIAAPQMIRAMAAAKQGSDMCSPGLSQRIALDAFRSGLTDRVLPPMLHLYRARRDALAGAMAAHLSETFDWSVPSGGMFIWATARDPGFDTGALLAVALRHGVCISPGQVFDPEGRDTRSMRLNFTLNPPERLEEAVRRLAAAVAEQAATAG